MINKTCTNRFFLAQTVTQVFVKTGVEMVAEQARAEICVAAKRVAGETAKTAAVTSGGVARTAVPET